MNITPLEALALNHYAFDEMNPVNGARPESADDVHCYVWIDELAPHLDISMSAAKGVVSSLVKKGLVQVSSDEDPQERGLNFTEEGYRVWCTIADAEDIAVSWEIKNAHCE